MDLRPQTFDEFIGNQELIEKLKIAVDAAAKKDEVISHCLLTGNSGTGKSTIAYIMSNELDRNVKFLNATTIEELKDLVFLLRDIDDKDIIFIDEIHNLRRQFQEHLLTALEDFKISVASQNNKNKKIEINLRKFTLIGATTRVDKLNDAFVSRFGIIHSMQFYKIEEIEQILKKNIEKMQLNIKNEQPIRNIARRSRGIPRLAIRLLLRTHDYCVSRNDSVIDNKSTNEAMKIEEIDENGLNRDDINYLKCLRDFYLEKPVGINSIAATMNQQRQTIEQAIEPFLLRSGYIVRTKTGRAITQQGKDAINKYNK